MDGRDDQGCTPLWQAARNGRAAALKLLLAAGADPTIPGERRRIDDDDHDERSSLYVTLTHLPPFLYDAFFVL